MKLESTPTTKWTSADRFIVIAEIAVAMRTVSKGREIHRSCIFDASERIGLLATMSPDFLEKNRAELLKDLSL